MRRIDQEKYRAVMDDVSKVGAYPRQEALKSIAWAHGVALSTVQRWIREGKTRNASKTSSPPPQKPVVQNHVLQAPAVPPQPIQVAVCTCSIVISSTPLTPMYAFTMPFAAA